MSPELSCIGRFAPDHGPHSVGLEVMNLEDRSRRFERPDGRSGFLVYQTGPRPIQAHVWYPAKPTTQRTMTIGDYCRSSVESGSGWAVPSAETETMSAVLGAPREEGAFPLVLYAPSFSAAAIENADLCEFLASHGYMVVAAPSQGPTRRSMLSSKSGLYAQAADLLFLLRWAKATLPVGSAPISALGFSWGGFANLISAALETDIDVVISLDGSFPAYAELLDGTASSAELTTGIAMLSVWGAESIARNDPAGLEGAVPNVGGSSEICCPLLCHADFSAMLQRNQEVRSLHLDPWHARMGHTRAEVEKALRDVAASVKNFLDEEVLGGETKGRSGTDRRDAAVSRRLRADMDAFANQDSELFLLLRSIAEQSRFARFGRNWAQRLGTDDPISASEEQVLEEQLLEWIRDLIALGRFREAVLVAATVLKICPRSHSLLIGLGEAQQAAGRRGRARAAFEKALGSGSDYDARCALARLRSDPSAS